MNKRIEQKGLRPRHAAYVIGAFWAIAMVVFGIVERLVVPKTFHSVWLGMWWAVETVTTVGYGDIVPNQTAGKIIAGFLMLERESSAHQANDPLDDERATDHAERDDRCLVPVPGDPRFRSFHGAPGVHSGAIV